MSDDHDVERRRFHLAGPERVGSVLDRMSRLVLEQLRPATPVGEAPNTARRPPLLGDDGPNLERGPEVDVDEL